MPGVGKGWMDAQGSRGDVLVKRNGRGELMEGTKQGLSYARPVRAALGRLAERAERFNWADMSYMEAR